MTMRSLLVILAMIGAGLDTAFAQNEVDAKDAFDRRQRDLVSLAGHLGTMHRLHQICGDPYTPDLFRNRMRELVPLESPMGSTRLDMIAAFNDKYRSASDMYLACDDDVKAVYAETAEKTLTVTDRLRAWLP